MADNTSSSVPRPWTVEEDDSLKEAVAEYGEEAGMWKTIAQRVPGRTNKACRKRWLHSLSPTIRKTSWTPEEDALLLKLYATHQPARWSLIAKHIPGRTDDACSKRYREALDPQLKKDGWTDEEDTKLLELTAQLGSKWTQVGQAMGRSGLGCRNRYLMAVWRRWRLLERKQRPRNLPRSSAAASAPDGTLGPASAYALAPEVHMTTPCVPIHLRGPTFHSGASPSAVPENTPFGDGNNARDSGNSMARPDSHVAEQIPATLRQVSSHSLIHRPPPSTTISTTSSLSGALASTSSITPVAHRASSPRNWTELVSTFHSPRESGKLPRATYSNTNAQIAALEDIFEPTPLSSPPSPLRSQSPPEPRASPTVIPEIQTTDPSFLVTPIVSPGNTSVVSGTRKQVPEVTISEAPRKRARLRNPASTDNDVAEYPRLSSHLPANLDRSILPYACGHPLCWPGSAGNGISRFATASQVAEHRRLVHPGDDSASTGEGSKAFRCALQGCGKGWKNINGIQYHLQISKAHFKAALSQTRAPSDSRVVSNIYPPDAIRAKICPPSKDKDGYTQKGKRKEYNCPHDGCTNTYKQRTGLQYHLTHGHPANVAQLDVIPPGLMQRITAESQPSVSATTEGGSQATPPRSTLTPDRQAP